MRQELDPTPGPWATEYRKVPGGYAQEVFDSAGKTIATCAWYPAQVSDTTIATNREANARLIATAPELLDLAQAVLRAAAEDLITNTSDEDTTGVLLDFARLTVAKATGLAANARNQADRPA